LFGGIGIKSSNTIDTSRLFFLWLVSTCFTLNASSGINNVDKTTLFALFAIGGGWVGLILANRAADATALCYSIGVITGQTWFARGTQNLFGQGLICTTLAIVAR
jgi:hypothetical protein